MHIGWNTFNPFSSDKNVWDYVPVVSGARSFAKGDENPLISAGKLLPTPLAPIIQGGEDLYHGYKNAQNDAYDSKRKGYDDVSAMAEQMKQERLKRQQDTYQQGMAALDPERNAIKALYGEPKSWKL
jgi:hypothetical protein